MPLELPRVCEQLESLIGTSNFHRLLNSVEPTRKRGRLLFWQEEILKLFEGETGHTVATVDDFVRMLEPAIAKILSEPPRPEDAWGQWRFPPQRPGKELEGRALEEWLKSTRECEDYDEKRELETDAVVRQATVWHDEAVLLAREAEAARHEGNAELSAERWHQAFESAQRAADHCQRVNDPEPVTRYHRIAAHYALACGEFRHAVRLSGWMGRHLDHMIPREIADKLWVEQKEYREIQKLAEELRQCLVANRLNEVAFEGTCAAFSSDSNSLVCATDDNHIRIYDISSQTLAIDFEMEFRDAPSHKAFHRHVTDLRSSPDGKTIAVAAFDGTILFWDCLTQKTRHLLTGHEHHVESVAFSPDSRLVASGGSFGTKLWDPITGKKRGSFARDSNNDEVAFSPDGTRIAWVRNDHTRLTVMDLASRTELYTIRSQDFYSDIAFSPCGTRLAVGTGGKGAVKFYEAENGREIVSFICGIARDGYQTSALAFSPDGKLLATASAWHVLLWDLTTRECLVAIPDTHPPKRVRFSPDGRFLFAAGSVTRVWRVDHLLGLEKDLSSLKGKMGTVEIPKNPLTAIEQAAAFTPVPSKMPTPEHLKTCTVAVKSRCTRTKLVANLQCPCGNKRFHLRHAGESWQDASGETFPKVAKVGDGFFFVIAATCSHCSAEHLLFDQDFHGWNGFVCRTDDHLRARPELTTWTCHACGRQEHTATIGVTGEDRQTAIEESGDLLTDANWHEAFGSISIGIKCCHCRHMATGWVLFETM